MKGYQKGQSAGPIMVLILLIALFIIIYLLLIPPADRENLLNRTGQSNTNNDDTTQNSVGTLLLESPGMVSSDKEDSTVRSIDPINLFVKYEPSIKTLSNSLNIERSSFGKQDQNIFFDLVNVEDIRRAVLTFSVRENRGELIINLNGNNIYTNEIAEKSLQLINLPTAYLEEKNELIFSVDSPGGAFWRTNKYILEDVMLKEEYEIINAQESRAFVLTKNELRNIDKSELQYSIYCNSLDSSDSSFRIYLNEKLISSQIVTCGSGQRNSDIDSSKFIEGENNLIFVIDQGDYLINEIKLVNKLKENEARTYYFNINSRDFFDIQDGLKDVFLQMSFGKEGTKIAEIWVNDFIIYIDTDSSSFSEDISELVEEGENFIRVLPSNEFLIRSLRVTLE